jgi:peptide/nickel transport system substrate-binding protein
MSAPRTSHAARRTLHLAVCTLHVLIAACGGSTGDPVDGDTLVFSASADVTTLDPHNTTDTQSDQAILMVFNTLIAFDEQMKIVPELAESWSVAPDQVTWTFKLRRGVVFHDGTAFDAAAVKKSFDRVLSPEQNHRRRSLFSAFDRVEVVDDQTVRFVTKHPFGAFEPTMAHVSAAIVSPAVAERYGKEFGYSAEATAGTGPYKVVRWRKDLEVVLERSETYWGDRPPLARIVYRPVPDGASRVIALEAGDADVITQIPATALGRLEANDDVRVLRGVSIGAQQFRFHCQRGPFRDARVRQAVSYAIDRRAILSRLMSGLAMPSTGPLTPSIRGRADLGEIPYDPQRARRLLAEAGYPRGFKTRITTTPRYNMGVELAEAVAANLAEVGIDAAIEVLEWGTIRSLWSGLTPEACPLEIFIMGAGASSADADWGLRPIFSTQPTNENNYGFYSNREFDELVLAAMREMDPARRNALYRRAQQIVYLDDPGAVWLFDNYTIVATRRGVAGVSTSPLGVVTFERARIER